MGQVPHIRFFPQQGALERWGDIKQALIESPYVENAEPYVQLDGLLSASGQVLPVSLEGLEFKDYALTESPHKGRAAQLVGGDNLAPGSGIYLAAGVAKQLNVAVGQRITLMIPGETGAGGGSGFQARGMTVAGVFETRTALDQFLAVTDLEMAASLAGIPGRVHGVQVSVDEILAVRQTAYSLLRELPPGMVFNDWLQTHGHLYQAIKMSRNLVSLLVFLIIGLAVFNVVSMLVMTVVDKKQAIAIYKTLGATKTEVLAIFLVQGMLIGVVGVLLGELLGLLLTFNIDYLLGLLESLLGRSLLDTSVYPIDFLPVEVRWQDC